MNREIKDLTLNFHYMYEKLAPEFGYETREDTKKFDFNSPNGKLMYKTVKSVMEPILEENQQLKEKLELSEKTRKEGIELLKDSSLEVNTREYGNLTVVNSDDLLEILDIDKGDR